MLIIKEKMLVQKDKINIIKAVCNNTVKKLAVLSLAIAVSGGTVASAQLSEVSNKRLCDTLLEFQRMLGPDLRSNDIVLERQNNVLMNLLKRKGIKVSGKAARLQRDIMTFESGARERVDKAIQLNQLLKDKLTSAGIFLFPGQPA